jgi:hypothetical protein
MGPAAHQIYENPLQRRRVTISASRDGEVVAAVGFLETECLSDPERANVPIIVKSPLPRAGAGENT